LIIGKRAPYWTPQICEDALDPRDITKLCSAQKGLPEDPKKGEIWAPKTASPQKKRNAKRNCQRGPWKKYR